MSEAWKIREPDQYHPHTMEISFPSRNNLSNWRVFCQERKSGAGRGASPKWYGFTLKDFEVMRAISHVPVMIKTLERAAATVNTQMETLGLTDYPQKNGPAWQEACNTFDAIHDVLRETRGAADVDSYAR